MFNIREMFGDTAVKRNNVPAPDRAPQQASLEPSPTGLERLTGDIGTRRVLDLDVPMITLPVMAGRNLAVLTEAATRMHILRSRASIPPPPSRPGTATSWSARSGRRARAGDRQRPVGLRQVGGAGRPSGTSATTVDNLPAELLPEFVRRLLAGDNPPDRIAVGIDARSLGDLAKVPDVLSQVGAQGLNPRLLFFDTRDEVLLRRYADTRRRHPLSHLGLVLPDAISLERQALRPVRQIADTVLDTSDLNVHQMRRRVLTEFGLSGVGLSLLFESFAYKRGVPPEADFVFDARVLPNPHWDARLRPLSGHDAEVREHLDSDADVVAYVAQVEGFLDTWLPKLRSETRSYATVAFGCTGGRHRSVYLAERFARHFREGGWPEVAVHHRELD